MAKARDLRFDENNDLFIDPATGDFQVTESDTRHVADIVESFVGWWKESPTVGVGVFQSSAASGNIQRISREVKIQMTGDGYKVTGIEIDKEGKIFGQNKNIKTMIFSICRCKFTETLNPLFN